MKTLGSEDEILIEVGRDCCNFTNVLVLEVHEFLIATLITRGWRSCRFCFQPEEWEPGNVPSNIISVFLQKRSHDFIAQLRFLAKCYQDVSNLLPSREYYCARPAVLICFADSHANEVLNEEVAQTLYTTMQVMVYNKFRNLYLFVCSFVYRVCPHVCCVYFLCMWTAQLDNLHLLHSLASYMLVCLFVCLRQGLSGAH